MFTKEVLATFIKTFERTLTQDLKTTGHPRLARVAERLRARYPTFLDKDRVKSVEVIEWTKSFAQALDQMVNELGFDDSVPYQVYERYSDYVNRLRGLGQNHVSTCTRELQSLGFEFNQANFIAHQLVMLNNMHPTTFTKLKNPADFIPKRFKSEEEKLALAERITDAFLKQFN